MQQPAAIFSDPVVHTGFRATATREPSPALAPLAEPEPPPALAPAPELDGSSPYDAELLAILEAPVCSYEPVAVGYARKEALLQTAIARLSIAEALQLGRRLAAPAAGDVLCDRFRRFTPERRRRVLAFAMAAPRRAAIAASPRGAR